MSDIITAAVAALSEKLGDGAFDGAAKFVIEGEGAVMVDASGVRAADEPADVGANESRPFADLGQFIDQPAELALLFIADDVTDLCNSVQCPPGLA